MSLSKEIRLVLLGKTGNGKSSLGNNLIGSKIFHAQASAGSLTTTCKVGERQLEDGKNLVVVDTPGLFDTRKSNQETSLEICRCIGLSSPGPHVFLFVIRIGRFTPEELETIEHLRNLFGENVMKYVVVVFTEKDSLDYDGKSLEDFVATAPQSLRDVLRACGSRCVTVNNRSSDIGEDICRVMEMVRRTISKNGGDHYTGEMYQAAERALKERMDRMEAEKRREREELELKRAELIRKEGEMERRENRQIKDLEQQLQDLRDVNPRQAVREEVEKKPGIALQILKTVGPIVLQVLTSVAASRCSIM